MEGAEVREEAGKEAGAHRVGLVSPCEIDPAQPAGSLKFKSIVETGKKIN